MRHVAKAVLTAAVVLLIPALAHAQATLAGTLRDSSGAVLPGVTVEATSPVLIEKVRTAVTDASGQYRITELLPGTYTLTFTLGGFAGVRREGVELSGSGVTTINAELRVGGLAETITVTGETPVVDIQSTRRQTVLDNEIVNTLPATRGYNALILMIPSVTVSGFFGAQSNNTQMSPTMTIFTSHGGRGNEGRVQVDGLNVGAAFNGGGVSGYIMDTSNVEELQFTLSGGLGEAETGGINLNIVPQTGGNTFKTRLFYSGAGDWSQGNNINDELRAINITEAGLIKNWDLSGAVGGPILKDRLWFHLNLRSFGDYSVPAGGFTNRNAGTDSFVLDQDFTTTQVRTMSSQFIAALRLTTQVTPRNKVGLFVDNQTNCQGSPLTTGSSSFCRSRANDWVALGGATTAPESQSVGVQDSFQRVYQGTWSSPVTNKLLFEAGFSSYISRWGWFEPPGGLTDRISVTQITPVFATYRGLDNFFNNWQSANTWRASSSYVTGAHSMKFGYQGAYHIEDITDFASAPQLTYTYIVYPFLNSLQMRIAPWEISNRTAYHSFYGQDQWTVGRLTVQGAVRYDHAYSFHPAEHNGAPAPSRWNATPITFPRTEGVRGYDDISARGGFAYDVFGNGKTSLKVNIGKYLEAANNQATYQANNPAMDGRNGRFQSSGFVVATNRTWADLNGNRMADCVLEDPAPNGECQGWDNLNFGKRAGGTAINQAILEGWGVRPWDGQLGASIQQEVVPRVSVEVGYHRRWFKNFFETDNLSVGPADFDRFVLTVPQDSRLPTSGQQLTYLDLKPGKFGQVNNYYTFETDITGGKERTQYWHGVDVTVNARMQNGLTIQGGTSTGRGVRDLCALWEALPELPAPSVAPFGFPTKQPLDSCKTTEPFQTQYRGLASYVVPKIDVQISGTFRSSPGSFTGLTNTTSATNGFSLAANMNPTVADTIAALGRPFSSGLSNVNLLPSGELYGDRLTYVDLRLNKILTFGGTRTQVGFDLFNLFNSNTPTQYQQTYNPNPAANQWLNAQAIQTARVVRFNVTVDF